MHNTGFKVHLKLLFKVFFSVKQNKHTISNQINTFFPLSQEQESGHIISRLINRSASGSAVSVSVHPFPCHCWGGAQQKGFIALLWWKDVTFIQLLSAYLTTGLSWISPWVLYMRTPVIWRTWQVKFEIWISWSATQAQECLVSWCLVSSHWETPEEDFSRAGALCLWSRFLFSFKLLIWSF